MYPVDGAMVPVLVVGARATVGAVVGAMNPVEGAMVPVVVAGAVAVDVEEDVAVEGETMEIVFCLLMG